VKGACQFSISERNINFTIGENAFKLKSHTLQSTIYLNLSSGHDHGILLIIPIVLEILWLEDSVRF